MKQNPKDIPVQESLRAGILARDGFLGEDARPFPQIIREDLEALAALGIAAGEVADAMERLTKAGLTAVGVPVKAGDYSVLVEEYMGRIPCPFRDHRAPKRNTEATDASGRSFAWSDLSIHLIRAHGFFQGAGSPFRLEPAALADFLGLAKPS